MTKIYEVVLEDNTTELMNLSRIDRVKPGEGGKSVVFFSSGEVKVDTQSLVIALTNAEIPFMLLSNEEPKEEVVEVEGELIAADEEAVDIPVAS